MLFFLLLLISVVRIFFNIIGKRKCTIKKKKLEIRLMNIQLFTNYTYYVLSHAAG